MHTAEISFTGWSNPWPTAGLVWGRRDGAPADGQRADAAAGDTWAMNGPDRPRNRLGAATSEVPARLADGGGNPAKGVVFISQNQAATSPVQVELRHGSGFDLLEHGRPVRSDWLRDVRRTCAPGASPARRASSAATARPVLGHPPLSNAGGDLTPARRSWLRTTALANAAWA